MGHTVDRLQRMLWLSMSTLCHTPQTLFKEGMATFDSGHVLSSLQLSDLSGMVLAAASPNGTFFMGYFTYNKDEKS